MQLQDGSAKEAMFLLTSFFRRIKVVNQAKWLFRRGKDREAFNILHNYFGSKRGEEIGLDLLYLDHY